MRQNPFSHPVAAFSRWFRRLGVEHPVARYMIAHWLLGMAIGAFCAASLLWINPLGFRDLLFRSDAMFIGLLLLFMGFSTMFGGIVCATAVMFPEDRAKDDGAKTQVAEPLLCPVAQEKRYRRRLREE